MERPANNVSGDVDSINFRDTQVKYGHTYNYRIYSIAMVFGTLYEYVSSGENLQVQYNDSCKIYEAPFFEKNVTLNDRPPLAPEVTFSPFQGISDKIEILFNHAVGNKTEMPIPILSTDSQYISKMRTSQFLEENDEINYLSDTIPDKYEMFMMTRPPRSYSDFSHLSSLVLLKRSRLCSHLASTVVVVLT